MAYSEKEKDLFVALGYGDMVDSHVEPITLYRMAAEECFLRGKSGIEVESLRRCLNSIHKMSPYRLTKEFDDLIVLPTPLKISDYSLDSWEVVMYHLVEHLGGDSASLCKWSGEPPKPLETALSILGLVEFHSKNPKTWGEGELQGTFSVYLRTIKEAFERI